MQEHHQDNVKCRKEMGQKVGGNVCVCVCLETNRLWVYLENQHLNEWREKM